jgi:hypothetical protein
MVLKMVDPGINYQLSITNSHSYTIQLTRANPTRPGKRRKTPVKKTFRSSKSILLVVRPCGRATFSEHSGNIQGTFKEHSGNIHKLEVHFACGEALRLRNIQGTFREHLGNKGKEKEG